MEKKFFYRSAYIIISLFPVLLITGPFLTDFFCITLGLLFFFYNFKFNNWKEFFYQNKVYVYFFLIFYIYLNLNSLFSFNPKLSFLSTLPFIRIIFFTFALGYFILKFQQIYKLFYFIFFISVFCLLIDSILQAFFNLNIFRDSTIHANRISSFFGNELIMGSYISRLLPIALASAFLANLKKKYLLNLILLIFSGILILLSGERLSFIYYFGIICIYFLVVKKYFIKFLILLILTSLLGVLLKPSITHRLYFDTISQVNQTKSVFSYRHTLHFKTAFEMFLDNKILGHGLKSFRYKCSDQVYEDSIQKKQNMDIQKLKLKAGNLNINYITEFKNGCNTHPHNIYLEYLAELGLIGAIFIITIFFYSSFKLIIYSYRNLILMEVNNVILSKILILSGIFLQLFPLLTSGSYFNNWMMIIFHLSFGFYLSLLKKT